MISTPSQGIMIIKHALSNEFFRNNVSPTPGYKSSHRVNLPPTTAGAVRARAHLGAILACIIDYEL